MKNLFKISLLTIATTMLFASKCKDEIDEPTEGTFNLKIELYNGTTPITWNEIISTGGMNEFRMDFFRYYLSHIALLNGANMLELKDVLLADAATSMSYDFTVKEGNYGGLKMGIGLDPLQNASDPVSFANAHPLSTAQSMYWSWASKYRFIRIDGRANQMGTVNSPDDVLLALHPGADEFYRERTFEKPLQIIAGQKTTFVLMLDVAKFFDGPGGIIDMQTEPQTHTSPEDYHIAEKFTDNFAAAFSLN